ncbi:MAG TPA: LuxR C-terminal-related transcriptional regulator [Glaciibacter sp.]|nr:LuxR C-terminal-related transcriptional regulator [Glaciibacter sp.]
MSRSSERSGLDRSIDRPALRSALDNSFSRRLTLIVAQAGAGKTTLLRQWSEHHQDDEFVFLDVESADDDPVHFARRLLAGLAVVDPPVARISKTIGLHDEGLGNPLITALATALEATPDLVIIIDDLHRLSNVRLVADLGELLQRLPRNVHLVLSSRFDPPIALSRYRLYDELLELRQSELAFNDVDAARLLEQTIGHPLAPSQVRALRERTEGWAAGLQLAGLGLRHERDADAFIADFGGSDRLVADYLGEEVLATLPTARRDFLLHASALDDMSAALVEAATGFVDAQWILEEFERESMFLVPLDTHREWFRFHHLFRELLRSRLKSEDPAGEVRILNAAADWHLSTGRVKPAIDYLLRAHAWDRALEAILSNASEVVANGDMLTVVRWMLSVPEPLRSARINEELLAGVRHAVEDRAAGTQSTSRAASSDLAGSIGQPPRGLGFIAAQVLWRARPEVSTVAAVRRIEEIEADSHARAAWGAPAAESSELADALIAAGRAYFLAGNSDDAKPLLARGLVVAASDVVERISGLSALSLVEAWCGNIQRADALVGAALLTAREAGMLAHPSIADAYLASVLTALERGEPRLARAADGHMREAVLLTEQETHAAPAPLVRDGLLAGGGRLLRLAGSPDLALDSLSAVRTVAPTVLFERAAAALTLHDTDRARDIVTAWDELVPVPEPLSVVQHHILQAWLADSVNATDDVARHLTQAVEVAEIYGLVDVFTRAGPLILDRLSSVTGPHSAFRDVIRSRAAQSLAPRAEFDLPDPLTDRELEILAYLPTRFTNVELADICFVSVNTIKTHMAHIYRKLDATNRDTAIHRARELGLL